MQQIYAPRPYLQARQANAPAPKRDTHTYRRLTIIFAIIISLIGAYHLGDGHAHAATQAVRSGVAGDCLDNYKNIDTAGSIVEVWGCNASAAQNWTVTNDAITHDGGAYCLAIRGDSTTAGSVVTQEKCSNAPGQVWLHDQGGYENPNSGMCLAVPGSKSGTSLDIATCALNQANQQWTVDGSNTGTSCNGETSGLRVACFAEQAWTAWQSGSPNHTALLTTYTDGNAYEEWCADFVSYIYQQAGRPFTAGERDNWDEYDANNIQNMGFTMHDAGSYTPKPGDVAFFNYPGGHVEIVVSGGSKPTFIYGDSATIDPSTGNGEMEANTITSDGTLGQVQYYLSWNGS